MLSGDLLKRLRLSRGISQQQLADAVGKSKRWIAGIERFEFRPTQELHDAMVRAIYDLPDRSKEDPKEKYKRRKSNRPFLNDYYKKSQTKENNNENSKYEETDSGTSNSDNDSGDSDH